MNCDSCQATLTNDANFCPSCGVKTSKPLAHCSIADLRDAQHHYENYEAKYIEFCNSATNELFEPISDLGERSPLEHMLQYSGNIAFKTIVDISETKKNLTSEPVLLENIKKYC